MLGAAVTAAAVTAAVGGVQLVFGKGAHGKPYLQPASAAAADQVLAGSLQFNLAHTQSVLGEHTRVS